MKELFSARTVWDLSESALTAAIREARAAGRSLMDLTVSNPTVCGFEYDSASILGRLVGTGSMIYDPDPRGTSAARDAVARYYAGHDAEVNPDQLVLTTSTSEAYSFLFRLLCDPGDEVLAAQPSYPLFDFLATLDDVELVSYPLFHDFGWWVDFAELERRITPKTKAVLVVHPNNPTGHVTSEVERRRLEDVCVRHGLALIVDEVFLDYGLDEPVRSFAMGEHPCLTFVLSGLSKVVALPQMKVAWICVAGPNGVRDEALARLEVIADTFLSVSAPAQEAMPGWLENRKGIEEQILMRVRENLICLSGTAHLTHLPVEAGWSGVLQLPQRFAAGDLAESLVREAEVIVHPASFYGMAGRHRVVVSLIGPTVGFKRGVERLSSWCESKGIAT